MAQQTDHIGDTNKIITAVEWLAEKLNEVNGEDNPWFDIPLAVLEQAKQMEKEQIMDAFEIGWKDEDRIGEEYYNQTYMK